MTEEDKQAQADVIKAKYLAARAKLNLSGMATHWP